MKNMIETKNLTKTYKGFTAVDHVSLHIILPACPCEQALTNTAILIPPLTRICVAVWKQS